MPSYPIEHRKVLGDYVRQMRTERGYADIDEWTAEVGRSDRYLLGLERGEPAGPKTIKAVAKALGVEEGELFRILNSGVAPEPGPWGAVGSLEDHAADLMVPGGVDLNVMFSQAVRFASTVGVLVPPVREEAQRVTVALSELFQHGLELWDQKPLDERADLFGEDEVDLILPSDVEGGDGNADADAGGSASTISDDSPAPGSVVASLPSLKDRERRVAAPRKKAARKDTKGQ